MLVHATRLTDVILNSSASSINISEMNLFLLVGAGSLVYILLQNMIVTSVPETYLPDRKSQAKQTVSMSTSLYFYYYNTSYCFDNCFSFQFN